MIMRKALPLALACGLLVSTTQPTKAITISPTVEHAVKLATTAFGINFLAYYAGSKLFDWNTNCYVLRNALVSSIAATGIITNICLIKSAILGNEQEKKQSN